MIRDILVSEKWGGILKETSREVKFPCSYTEDEALQFWDEAQQVLNEDIAQICSELYN